MSRCLSLTKLYLWGHARRQVYLATIFAAVILLGLPSYVNAFSLGTNAGDRVATDFGLTLIGGFGLAMAVLMGSTSVPRELESRAVYPILARPISRGEFLAAHYLSLAVLLACSLAFLGLCLSIALSLSKETLEFDLFVSVFASFLQASIIAAVCLAFSIRCSPALAGTIGVAVVLIGGLSGAFIHFFLGEDRGSVVSTTLAQWIKAVLPNLSLYAIRDASVHNLALPSGYLIAITVYALLWVLLLLTMGRLAFQRLDL